MINQLGYADQILLPSLSRSLSIYLSIFLSFSLSGKTQRYRYINFYNNILCLQLGVEYCLYAPFIFSYSVFQQKFHFTLCMFWTIEQFPFESQASLSLAV